MEKQNLSLEAIKELYKAQEANIKGIMKYKLPKILEDTAQPLTFKEKRALSDYNLREVDDLKDDKFDELIEKLLEERGVEDIDDLSFSDLQIWVNKIMIATFNLKAIYTKN